MLNKKVYQVTKTNLILIFMKVIDFKIPYTQKTWPFLITKVVSHIIVLENRESKVTMSTYLLIFFKKKTRIQVIYHMHFLKYVMDQVLFEMKQFGVVYKQCLIKFYWGPKAVEISPSLGKYLQILVTFYQPTILIFQFHYTK